MILQTERSECALACLAMVLNYFGHRIDLNTLRSRCPVSQHGITLKGVITLASRLHLAARPLRLEPADIPGLSLPAMLHWDMDHFVILGKATGKYLQIHDPAAGRRRVTWKEAGSHFTGVAIEFLPADGFEPRDERQRLTLHEVWRNADGCLGSLVQLLVLSLLLQAFALALPFYTQILLDDVIVSRDTELLTLLAAGFLLLVVFRQLAELVRAYVVLFLSNRVSFQFATRMCRHLLHLPQAYFARRHLGDTVSRFGSLNNVRDFLCSGIVEIVIDGMMVIGTLLLMFLYSTLLALIALAAVVLYGILRLVTYHRFRLRNEEWLNDRAVENTLFMENVSAIQGIKLFGREGARLAGWQNRYADAIRSGMHVQKLGILVRCAHGLLLGVENVVLLLVGAQAVLAGTLTVGMLMAFIGFKDHFFRSMFSLLDKGFEFRLLDVHLDRLADMAFCEPEISGSPLPVVVRPGRKGMEVVLERIACGYDPDAPPLFRDVCLDLGKCQITAIIGPTGCGKSTLLKIVASLVRPTAGRLLCNGRRVDAGTLESYRAGIGGVMQNDTLLSGSLLENITFFDTTPDIDRAREAARRAMIADDIAMMPMQFQTMAGNMGSALSGGQVQRILLARALYKEPALLVLDEATSHLDIQTETRVNASLRQLDIPCLLVAHRPETVLQADRIFRLGPGGLVPVSHAQFRDLMSNKDNNDVIRI